MQNTQLLALLSGAGLNEKEAGLYLAGLELGEASLQQLAKEAGIKRPTAYDVIRELEGKGLFSQSIRNKKRYFVAEDPEVVLGLLKTREEALARALPSLKLLLQTGGRKPRVKFYDGVEGLKAMYWDTLGSKGTILVYGSIDDMWGTMPREFIRDYVKERVKRNINIRGLVPNTSDAQEYTRRDKERSEE